MLPMRGQSRAMGQSFNCCNDDDHSLPAISSNTGRGGDIFTTRNLAELPIPVLVAVPHAGRDYPVELESHLRHPGAVKMRLEDRYVDILGTAIVEQTGAPFISARAPRALIDLNRATDDVDWSMISGPKPPRTQHSIANRRARSGLGLIPRRLNGQGEIWRHPLARDELDRRIDTVHRPYHAELGTALQNIRDRWGIAVLLDLHSMPPLKPRFSEDAAAEFVIGDRFGASCDHRLSAGALTWFASMGRRAAHNRPYSGGYVLDRHGTPLRGIHAIQLEVCRSTYLDAKLDQPSARIVTVARLLAGLVRHLAEEAIGIGEAGRVRNAAE